MLPSRSRKLSSPARANRPMVKLQKEAMNTPKKGPPKTQKVKKYSNPQKLTTPKIKVSAQCRLTVLGIEWMLKTLMELDEFQISKVSHA